MNRLISGFDVRTSKGREPITEFNFIQLAKACGFSDNDALGAIVQLGRRGYWHPATNEKGIKTWKKGKSTDWERYGG